MKNYNLNSKFYYSFIIILFCYIAPGLSQVKLEPISKPISTKINLKSVEHPNANLFNKIRIINNVNYHNYVYEFYTKSNKYIKGSVREVGNGYVKVKIMEGYKEHKYMFLPFDSISHFQEYYSGE